MEKGNYFITVEEGLRISDEEDNDEEDEEITLKNEQEFHNQCAKVFESDEDDEEHLELIEKESCEYAKNESSNFYGNYDCQGCLYETWDGRISKFESCRSLLDKAKAAGLELQDQLENLRSENAALQQSKNEIFTKLKGAEATIKWLRDQVNGLLSSESMMRMRDNNLKSLNNLKENHNKEILNYNKERWYLRAGESKVEKTKRKEIWDKEKKLENETSKTEFSKEVSKQVAEKVKEAKHLWEKEETIKIQRNILEKVNKMLQHFQIEKISDSAAINYLERIKELEMRAKETEEALNVEKRQHAKELAELEAKLRCEHEIILGNMTTALEIKFVQEKQKLITEIRLENQKRIQEKVEEQKALLNKKFEYLARANEQKYLTALNTLKESHTKEKKCCDDTVSQIKDHLDAISKLQGMNREQLVKDEKERYSVLNTVESLKLFSEMPQKHP